MPTLLSAASASLATAMALMLMGAPARAAENVDTDALLRLISALDHEAFDAFNRCSDPKQLEKHASYFSPQVEFYHDTGGVTWNRVAMLENTQKYACGNYRRELIPGSFRVYSIKDFGAISQGTHRFCGVANGQCEGSADFTIVWQHSEGRWLMSRVLSYGHRSNNPSTAVTR